MKANTKITMLVCACLFLQMSTKRDNCKEVKMINDNLLRKFEVNGDVWHCSSYEKESIRKNKIVHVVKLNEEIYKLSDATGILFIPDNGNCYEFDFKKMQEVWHWLMQNCDCEFDTISNEHYENLIEQGFRSH